MDDLPNVPIIAESEEVMELLEAASRAGNLSESPLQLRQILNTIKYGTSDRSTLEKALRLMTDRADAATRRLLIDAADDLGDEDTDEAL
ncbi:hypothetical protein GCM10011583_71530 [Streptomyces camponoticapitis]|uniref:Uncharacterized protein n=1 Tax=Streptomyces camponoticapitis TaxID=1616125 RepID=A0ABQ2EWJ4_9ACTN|nr:hypothetical protein [Streptomyces camponoticapitis]GGK29314.1 hypothetical protein GCM10011583_71530 [Streptomyces camponoticapitis]